MANKKTGLPGIRTVERERKELLQLMLQKAGLTYKDLVKCSVDRWMTCNLDLVTEEERKRFKSLVF